MRTNRAGLLLALCFLAAALPAEAPELRFVMPNSWRLVTRLPPAEEAAFLRDNGGLLETVEREAGRILGPPFGRSSWQDMAGTPCVYRERIGEDVFYRLVMPDENPGFSGQRETSFLQVLLYEHRGRMAILGIAPYNGIRVSERWGGHAVICSLDIVRAGGRARGVLGTLLNYRLEDPRADRLVKGQIQGFRNRAAYVLMEELLRALGRGASPERLLEEGLYQFEGMPVITVSASPCLVDPAVPLRYSLQNAFDGDPATSFVENTEDDLMWIDLTYANCESIERIALINGYTQNRDLYFKNNRVREIVTSGWIMNDAFGVLERTDPVTGSLVDSMFSWQFFDCSVPYRVSVTGIYPGTVYSDTCIAEFNFMIGGIWVFGGIDE